AQSGINFLMTNIESQPLYPKMYHRFPTARSIWKVIFAITALVEVQYITILMRKVDDSVNDSESDEYCRSTLAYNDEDSEFSINYTFLDRAWESTITIGELVFVWAGPFFCSLCIVESLVRAVEARNAALDNRALDDLEKSLLDAAQKSSIRLSMFFTGAAADQEHKKKVKKLSKALRMWVPAIATIAFWLFILPTDIADFHHRCGSDRLHDTAVVTHWINRSVIKLSNLVSAFHGLLESIFWTKILPYRIHKEPQRFIQRLQVILRWIRFGRFAGPLFRMTLKLQDQMRAVWKARRQGKANDLEKQRRIDRPSMIFADIQKLTQLAKVQTALARVPSFSLQSSPRLSKFSASVIETYNKRRIFGKKISEQVVNLQKDATSDLYDRIVKISQDITISMDSEKGNYSHRYLKSLRALLSSREYLISPRTRFSLAWRVTVTNCLMLEIARLCASWHLSETFSISLSQIVGRLLVHCKAPEETKHHLAFITNHINQFRRKLFDAFPLFGPPPVDIAVCIPSGPQALLILHFGRMLEFFVDVVVFMDIFVWFSTGDIDIDTHAIIPKPFFTRCILPGTLVQVLDHPTLPDLLPGLLKSALAAFATIGYSRCIRWILALVPAFKMLVLDPLKNYFFEHIDEDDLLMNYAESVGMLTPERKSGMLYGSTGSFGALSQRHFFHRKNSDAYNTSQVGLTYDASPMSSRYELSSMVSTEGSSMDGTERQLLSTPRRTTFSGMPMENNSPLKKQKSVHFGLFDDNENQSVNNENIGLSYSTELRESPSYNKSVHFGDFDSGNRNQPVNHEKIDKNVGYSLSANELHVPENDNAQNTQTERISATKEEMGKSEGVTHLGSMPNDILDAKKGTVDTPHADHGSEKRNQPVNNEQVDKNVGYSLSANELHVPENDNAQNTQTERLSATKKEIELLLSSMPNDILDARKGTVEVPHADHEI
ncbi:hypothetical protein ACHAXR_011306, partial [Thalassiosira sp. AJA248-18]